MDQEGSFDVGVVLCWAGSSMSEEVKTLIQGAPWILLNLLDI